jgi:hypothetical protein
MSNYHFITRWTMPATCATIYRTLENAEDLARWWPSVYLDVITREKGQAGGVGKVVELYTKGWLPYTLRWNFRVTHTNFPHGFAFEAFGDFVGRGVWSFKEAPDSNPENPKCAIEFDWEISVDKPLIKWFTPVLRPLFSANHEWAMARGAESLQIELRRQQAQTEAEKNMIPLPPRPTFPHHLLDNKVLQRALVISG